MPDTFWVVEKFQQDKSAGYFEGGDSFEGFTANIEVALQFRRKQDAERVISFMFGDLRATEHGYMAKESPNGE